MKMKLKERLTVVFDEMKMKDLMDRKKIQKFKMTKEN